MNSWFISGGVTAVKGFLRALDGLVLGDVVKDSLLKLIKRLSGPYFAEIIGFCLMGNPPARLA